MKTPQQRYEAMLSAMFEGLATYEEVKELTDAFVDVLEKAKKELSERHDAFSKTAASTFDDILRRMKAAEKSLDTKATKSEAATKKELNQVISTVKKDLRRLRDMIPQMPKSFDASGLQSQIDELSTRLTVNYSAEEIRNMLELLEGDERLDVSAIRGLEELIAQAKSDGKTVSVGGGPRGIYVYVDGIKKGLIPNFNFAAGTGMAISFSYVNGMPTLTFESSASGGTTVETPPEIPDAVITEFTVSAEPKWIVADGTTYFAGAGYSYNSGTGKITTDVPPSASIRVII